MRRVEHTLLTIARQRCQAARLLGGSLAILATSLTACGTSSGGGDTTPPDGGGDGGMVAQPDVGKILDTAMPCTEAHTICLDVQLPSSPFAAPPESLQVVLYFAEGQPSTPPDGFAAVINSPMVVPGETVHVQGSDVGLQGDLFVWSIMYMTGGAGYGRPLVGVDYGQKSAPIKVHLDGSAVNIPDPIVLALF